MEAKLYYCPPAKEFNSYIFHYAEYFIWRKKRKPRFFFNPVQTYNVTCVEKH